MTNTPNLQLPKIDGQQALKHITHNEALVLLDGMSQIVAENLDSGAPPLDPALGSIFGVEIGTDDWVGKDGQLALWTEGGWRFVSPRDGWLVWHKAQNVIHVRIGGVWEPLAAHLGSIQNATKLGVNTTADDTNKLAVRSNAVLVTGTEAGAGGTGDIRLSLNKETISDTGSLVFQTGYSGRAEIGLAGNDDFAFKVSADGSVFNTSLTFDAANGFVTFGQIVAARITYPVTSAGVLTITSSYAVPAPESGTIDEIDTLAGGKDGALLIVSGTSGNQLTFKDGTGNLKLGADRVLNNFEDTLMLVRRGTDWLEISFANNG